MQTDEKLRLAYTLSAGTADLLAGTRLLVNHVLTLHLAEGSGVFAGESVTRRLERLGLAMGRDTMTAVDDLKFFQIVAEEHSNGLKKFTPAFAALYDALTPAQKTEADRIFKDHRRVAGY